MNENGIILRFVCFVDYVILIDGLLILNKSVIRCMSNPLGMKFS